MDRKKAFYGGSAGGGKVAAMAAAAMATAEGARVIENKGQAMPKGAQLAARGPRAQRKARARAAGLELMAASRMTLDVSRLHPRWLRAAVQVALDSGQPVTPQDIDRWRAQGRQLAFYAVALREEIRK